MDSVSPETAVLILAASQLLVPQLNGMLSRRQSKHEQVADQVPLLAQGIASVEAKMGENASDQVPLVVQRIEAVASDVRDIKTDLREYYGGMKAALPEEVWVPYERQPATQLARTLVKMARHVDPAMLLKHPRGPKPRKKKGYAPGSEVRRQVATSRVLAAGTVDHVKEDV